MMVPTHHYSDHARNTQTHIILYPENTVVVAHVSIVFSFSTMAGPPEEIMPSTTTEVPPAEEQNVSDEVKDSLQGDDEPMEPPLSPANVPEKADLSELEGSGHESFGRVDDDEDPEEETTEEARSPTPPIQREVKVKFSGMEGPSPPPELDLGGVTRSQLVQKVGGLQERLTQTQIDLKQEKSARRKKDKNMFKMAKELSKRQVEATEKDEVIQKVRGCVICYFSLHTS